MERALLAWLTAVVVIGGGWLWAVVASAPAAKRIVAIGGGSAALALALTIAVAVYHYTAARRARAGLSMLEGGTVRLEGQIRELCEQTLPTVTGRIREGAPADTALSEVTQPASGALQLLLRAVAHDLAEAQRGMTAVRAASAAIEDEAEHLLESTLPVMVKRIRGENASAGTVLASADRPTTVFMERLQVAMATELSRGQSLSASTLMACASAAARVQAQATSMLALLRELQHRYDDEEVFTDLLEIDHRVSQMGRLADSIALLSGGRSGRRWTKPIIMESILRGAMGRIADYRRIRLHSANTSAVAGHAAEGVMHTLAELMDNATLFSTRDNDVHVYVEEEDAGVVITIEDSGLGMRRRERARAERLIADPTDMTGLPGTRLGLAVVGRLAHKHGLRISFRPSSRGGIGVVVMIPRHLITRPRHDPFADMPSPVEALNQPAALTTGPQRAVPAPPPAQPVPAQPVPAPAAQAEGGDFDDLPQRRRGHTFAASPDPHAQAEPAPPRDRRDSAARFAAFRQASGRGRNGGAEPAGGPPEERPADRDAR